MAQVGILIHTSAMSQNSLLTPLLPSDGGQARPRALPLTLSDDARAGVLLAEWSAQWVKLQKGSSFSVCRRADSGGVDVELWVADGAQADEWGATLLAAVQNALAVHKRRQAGEPDEDEDPRERARDEEGDRARDERAGK